jgi:hypothetical protein
MELFPLKLSYIRKLVSLFMVCNFNIFVENTVIQNFTSSPKAGMRKLAGKREELLNFVCEVCYCDLLVY